MKQEILMMNTLPFYYFILGYYQPLVPEAVPLVEALMQDLLSTTHNLKICKENKKCDCKSVPKTAEFVQKSSKDIHHQKDVENAKIIGLQKKVEDFELLYKESLEIIKNLQIEIEERNKKLLRLELSQKAQIVTQSDKRLKAPRMEVTALLGAKYLVFSPLVPSKREKNICIVLLSLYIF